jgi:uncharacterized protein (TIGR03032 family)
MVNPAANSPLPITISENFGQWLRHHQISLAFTTYQTNRLIFVGTKANNAVTLNERLFDKPMGLFAHADRLHLATRYQIWQFDNLLQPGEQYQGGDRLYVPSVSHTTGSLNVHDVVVDGRGQLLFVNTDFSCLATIARGYSFKPVWQPHFIKELRSEDSCHLNGLALVDGKATYMTACSATHESAGWRNCRLEGGIVLHIPSNEIIATGLSMPHSPRWYRGKLWLLNAGTGDFGYLDGQNQFTAVAFCPGFVRGLAFWQNYAFVGVSKLRSQSFTGLTLEKRLMETDTKAHCGLLVIDINTGQTIHHLYFDSGIEELFDVVILPNALSPKALGFQDEDIERLITFPGSKGIITTKPTVKRPSIGEKAPIAGLPTQARLAEEREYFANEAVKYQRVYHLNPESLAPYDAMTFPSLQRRWQTHPQRGELVGISASLAGEMVGFLIAELLPDSTAEIISLKVAAEYRQRGIATKLFILLETELSKEKCTEVAVIYGYSPLIESRLTPLLQKFAWQAAVAIGNHQKKAIKSFINPSLSPLQRQGDQGHQPQPGATPPVQPDARLQFEAGKQRLHNQDIEGAIDAFRSAISIQPDYLPPYNQLGNALQLLGDTKAAIQAYQQLLTLNPNIAPAYNNLASCLQLQNNTKEAIQAYQKAIQLKPDFSQAYRNLAVLFSNEGEFQQAEQCLQHILSVQPNNPEIHYDLGNLLRSVGKNDAAIDCFRQAIKLKPDYSQAYQNLGCLLMMRNQMSLAQACFEKVLKLEPDNAECHGNYGHVLEAQDHFILALQAYDRALSLKPEALNILYQQENLRLTLCDWQDFDERMALLEREITDYLRQGKSPLLVPLVLNGFNFPIALHRQINQQWGYHITRSMTGIKQQSHFSPRIHQKVKLRVGYVSNDFRCHAMGVLIHQMFQYHDRESFEVYCYSIGDYEDEMTDMIKQGCDQFATITFQSPQETAQRIYQDGIDILIDLMGYTNLSRPAIFALQPAPIQISYLGHPNTMGADFMQYIIADATIIPPELEKYYNETVIALPHAFVASPLDAAAKTFTRQDFGLPENAVVYGCFNRSNKINPHLFALWLEILRQVPGSVLWFFENQQEVKDNLQNEARTAGIDPNRLIFSPKLPIRDFSQACSLADLFLDSYIYNAGSTAVSALWGGLPILTCTGDIFVSRMGASICQSVGLESLICDTPLAYQAKAIALGQNPSELQALKQALLAKKLDLPLFQPQQWIASLEDQLTQIWENLLMVNSRPDSQHPYQFNLEKSRKGDGDLFTVTRIGLEPLNNQDIPKIRLVSATREHKDNFFTKTALGRSLLNYNIPSLELKLFTENTVGLPPLYNRIIEESRDDDAILLFIHDDVTIDDPHWLTKTLKALTVFDIVGVAGNKRRLPQQPSWYFTDTQGSADTRENLSGIVYHAQEALAQPSLYGAFFQPVKLLDGLMLICHSQTLITNNLRFDDQFNFHFYDLDFCRQAEVNHVTMGTWNIWVTHDSGGTFGDKTWHSNYDRYLRKWIE